MKARVEKPHFKFFQRLKQDRKAGRLTAEQVKCVESRMPAFDWGTAGRKTPEYWVEVSERRAAANGGKLEYNRWLINNGLAGIVRAKQKRPELFSHIPQASAFKEKIEKVKVDELQLAREQARKLVNKRGCLRECDIKAKPLLSRMLDEYPGEFAEFTRIAKRKLPLSEWQTIARKLTLPNGMLPHGQELKRLGYLHLRYLANKHPSLFPPLEVKELETVHHFKGIPGFERKGRRSLEEWLVIYKRLLTLNNGVRPSIKWMSINGYKGLRKMITKYRNEFELPRTMQPIKPNKKS